MDGRGTGRQVGVKIRGGVRPNNTGEEGQDVQGRGESRGGIR